MLLQRRVTIHCTKIIIIITVNSVARFILVEQKSVLLNLENNRSFFSFICFYYYLSTPDIVL